MCLHKIEKNKMTIQNKSNNNVLSFNNNDASPEKDTQIDYRDAFSNWKSTEISAKQATIGILEGEGIGKELMDVCRTILERISQCTDYQFDIHLGGEIGTPAWKQTGHYVSDEVVNFCRDIHANNGALLCGPGGGRFVYDLRSKLDLYCKLTPLKPVSALNDTGPLRPESVEGVDILMVRENKGGLYQGEHSVEEYDGQQRFRHSFDYTEDQVRRILQVSFNLAQMRRGKLCVIYKPGGVPGISSLWKEQAENICHGTDIELSMLEVDNACYQLVADAHNFDVVASPNMFGDVLADGATVLLGSRGLSYSANFSDEGMGIYQTGHGAAQGLAGTNLANPLGQILSMVFMLRQHFNMEEVAISIETAIEGILSSGWRTADIMTTGNKSAGTILLGELIADVACAYLTIN